MSRDQRPGRAKIVDNGSSPSRRAGLLAPGVASSANAPAVANRADAPATRPPAVSMGLLSFLFVGATIGSAATVAALFALPL